MVLSGQKQLMPLKEVKRVQVPKFEELSVETIGKLMEKDETFVSYFPDKLPKGRNPGREYTWNIANTLNEQYVAHLINHANRQRYTAENEEKKNQTIEITDEWWEMLNRDPYISRKYSYVSDLRRV